MFGFTGLLKFITGKGKAVPLHAMEALGEERRYTSYSFSNSALDGGEWSASCLCRPLAPAKGPPIPIVQEAAWAPEQGLYTEARGKILCPRRGSNPDLQVAQPVVRHYTA
jgi:hypothetical protein